ncbi:MAG: discoidin domain-containing protein, partial [Candidatus Eisenbacteria bacterium]
SASSTSPGSDPRFAVDGDAGTAWESAAADRAPWLALDLGGPREYGGLVVDWATGGHARRYAVEISDNGAAWRPIRSVERGNGGRDYLYLPETESRHVRLRVVEGSFGESVAIRELTVEPLEFSASRNAFFEAIARDAPRGSYPRGMSGEAVYWTVVGFDGDTEECLLGEDGAIEVGSGEFSIEPFLVVGGRWIAWSDVRPEQSRISVPTQVKWRAAPIELHVLPYPTGRPGASSVFATYYLINQGTRPDTVTLLLTIRPFQVNPPYQLLNVRGGWAPIREIRPEGSTIHVSGGNRGDRRVVSLTPYDRFVAAAFDEGDLVNDYLRRGALPDSSRAVDPFGAASGALVYELELPPGGGDRVVRLEIPLHEGSPSAEEPGPRGSLGQWLTLPCRGARIGLFGAASEVARTLEAQIRYILVNRAGPAIQPGTRAYARSWIRDGALTSSALLRMGYPEPVREFIEWFAPNQYENGKIPCVVDARGPDPVPEHDSGGEFIFLVAEWERYTGDRGLVDRMWPRVEKAAAYLDSLRQTRRTPEYREPGKEHFFGLLPPSISHEGYSAKPMHSYWDDLWALRGFKDAAYLAGVLGREEDRRRWTAVRVEFERELAASIDASMEAHGIDYIPGCADLGDFDATSTTIALSPVQAEDVLPPDALRRTFERYWTFFRERRETDEWEAFTPYEMRNIGAFVRLGWRERAAELVDFFLSYRRPAGWAQWAEVVWRDERAPKFIGDMPHTWVGSDFVRSVLDMLVYPRESDESLVVGAGVPLAWLREPPGVEARGLPTPYGPIDLAMRAAGETIEVRIDGSLNVPPGGIVVRAPLEGEGGRITVNGKPAEAGAGRGIVVREVPAVVRISP